MAHSAASKSNQILVLYGSCTTRLVFFGHKHTTSTMTKSTREMPLFGFLIVGLLVLLMPNELMSMLDIDNGRKEDDLIVICDRIIKERRKRRSDATVNDNGPSARKCKKSNWSWERGRMCVQQDYWGPSPRFNDRQFERVFRISRRYADLLMQTCGTIDPFFTQRYDAVTG